MANHIYVISQNDSSKLKIFVVVNKIQINIAYARYKIHHTHTQHTLNQHPVESRASHKNNACFEELVHSKHNFNWYKVEQVKRVRDNAYKNVPLASKTYFIEKTCRPPIHSKKFYAK